MLGRSELSGAIGAFDTRIDALGGLPAVPDVSDLAALQEEIARIPGSPSSALATVPEGAQTESAVEPDAGTILDLLDRWLGPKDAPEPQTP